MWQDSLNQDEKCVRIEEYHEAKEKEGSRFTPNAHDFQLTQASVVHRTFNHQLVRGAQACRKKKWLQFDEDANSVLEVKAKGNGDKCSYAMTTIIVVRLD